MRAHLDDGLGVWDRNLDQNPLGRAAGSARWKKKQQISRLVGQGPKIFISVGVWLVLPSILHGTIVADVPKGPGGGTKLEPGGGTGMPHGVNGDLWLGICICICGWAEFANCHYWWVALFPKAWPITTFLVGFWRHFQPCKVQCRPSFCFSCGDGMLDPILGRGKGKHPDLQYILCRPEWLSQNIGDQSAMVNKKTNTIYIYIHI